jgi:hypothetical protein
MADPVMAPIQVQTSDDQIVDLPREYANMCGTLRNLVGDLGDDQLGAIPVKVSSEVLEKVQDFCKKYKDEPTKFTLETETTFREKRLTGWEGAFVDVSVPMLFDMIEAASYLDLEMMLNITAKSAADRLIKDATPAETMAHFGLQEDISEEEMAAVFEEHPWLRDIPGTEAAEGPEAAEGAEGTEAAEAEAAEGPEQ